MDAKSPGSIPVQSPQLVTFDTILPATIALRAEESGVKRAAMDPLNLFVLSILGGAFVAVGAFFATTVSAGAGDLPYGVVRLLNGLVFPVGLVLIVIGGAELFTGNNLIVMAWASGKIGIRHVFINWVLAFAGNFVGAFLVAILMFYTTQYTFSSGAVGLVALNTANAKASLAFGPALTLGIMCNALVCLAVWTAFGARTNLDKIATIFLPIAAFVAAGFEHCIANIYFIPMGLFIKAGAPNEFWASIGKTASDFPALTWQNFAANLLPVTIGNIIGGSFMVAAVYWFIYLRDQNSKGA
jgi:formate transporter